MMSLKKTIWILFISIFVFSFLFTHNFNSRYTRSINGDAKGYYAYLPAIFIYQDANYDFIDKMEMAYYPKDRSQYKAFKNIQNNGKSVNKCFPGLALFYLPFFGCAVLFAWLAGIPVDGYSLPFQFAIGFAHVTYMVLGFVLLYKFLSRLNYSKTIIWFSFFTFSLGTTIWYYTIYDHTVSHIFNFFLCSLYVWNIQKWITTKNNKWLGIILLTICIFVISRPTNALMVLFIPFIFKICNEDFIPFIKSNINFKSLFKFAPLCLILISIPPLLWKWQSGLWFVYSYNNEGFNFLSPQLFNFIFSFKKGWLLWSPLLLFVLIFSLKSLFKESISLGLTLLLPLSLIIYVLSSWWCWTYGTGMGQRAMIDFYPFLIISFVYFLNKIHFHKLYYYFVAGVFIILNLFQSFQIQNSIHRGGETTSIDYFNHFFEWKTIVPIVKIDPKWKLIRITKSNKPLYTDRMNHFSETISSDSLKGVNHVVIDIVIGSKHKDNNINLVLTNGEGSIYESYFFADLLYEEPRKISVVFNLKNTSKTVFKSYVWNHDTDSKSTIKSLKMKFYH